ncbi:hypothetical protein EJ05DRAFT_506299 [Pseudovirgaria hyperparasitica]|uniref:Uncharacterized protein n=1 Tax=Pseudovirgaria hyperparasitica TaxID=470096 RepID=A0A6A6WK91_9PEZI|nr:uncharacterized protein EJ05DRAFT_506299 [Pseudovirgaria hyperparasitica]KAF2762590.1 hypothetical protein EJ05DRAFT_506299 [Pseudovirgaria hyperparasitica]
MASSSAVNRPTDVKQKETDVNNKLQLYGIYSAFANGKAPSNKQIDIALNSFLASKPISAPSKKLSPEGQKLVEDFRDVVTKAKLLLLTKNSGNVLQDFIWQTQQLGEVDVKAPGAPVDKDTAKQHGNEALDGLRTLGTLLISNGQFRKLLSDASILLRDIAGDAAQNAANVVNPDEDALNQIDKPADDNVWHDTPDLSAAKLKEQAKNISPFKKSDLDKAAADASEAATGTRDPNAAGDIAAKEAQSGQDQGVDAQGGLAAGASTLKNAASENIDDKQKDKVNAKAKELREKTDKYLKSKMPKERREQTIWRLKKMVIEVQGHQDYLQAIETLLRLAEEYTGHGRTLAEHGQGQVKGAHGAGSLKTAEADLKTLIERFANSTSLDDLFESINAIYKDADQDPELKQWFKDVDTYIRKCLKQQGFIMEDESTRQYNELYDRGRYLLREKYRTHTDRVLNETKSYANQFDADPQNKEFGLSLQKLFQDLGNDENGKPTFKPHLVKDLTEVILPAVFESVRYVPIPRIEYSDNQVDAIIENLVIESDNLMPNIAEFGSDNYWRWGRKQVASKNKNKVMLSVSGIQMDLKDVSYYVKRKQGTPKITDKGVVDLFLGGSGLSFKIEMETADKDKKDNAHFFKVNKVSVDIKNMKIKIKKSSHKLLFTLFKSLALKTLRPAIEKAIEKQIKDQVNALDSKWYAIHKEAEKAKEDAKRDPSPENVQNIYQRYYAAMNKKVLEGKKKADKAKEAQVNVAVTQHDSIFKDITLPGGISSKATDYKNLAAKGEKWESPVFSIGNAAETPNVPSLKPITRAHANGSSAIPTTTTGAVPANGFSAQVDDAFKSAPGVVNGSANTAPVV